MTCNFEAGSCSSQDTLENVLDLGPFRLKRINQKPFIAAIPGSKSYTNRALILAAQRLGRTQIEGALHSEDTDFLAQCLNQFGNLSVQKTATGYLVNREHEVLQAPRAPLYAGGGGTPARLLISFAVMVSGKTVIDGNARLRERPMGDLLDALKRMGIQYEHLGKPGCLPVRITGGQVQENTWYVNGSTSSQFLTSLLLLAPQLNRPITIKVEGRLVSKSYIEMTLQMMRDCGLRAEHKTLQEFLVYPGTPQKEQINIEIDASAMSYFLGAAAITGSTVIVPGISQRSKQGDVHFARLMSEMGAKTVWHADRLEISGGQINGIHTDMDTMPDTVLTLAVVASQASGGTTVSNIANLKIKESDRIGAIVTELNRLGVPAIGGDDFINVSPSRSIKPATVETYNDHRVAMAFSLLGLMHDGVKIENPKCVEKSFPEFWSELARFVKHHNREEGCSL